MTFKLFLYVTLCFSMSTLVNGASSPIQSLWDQVVRQEQIILSVIYKGRSLSVWKQNVDKNYTRFYVTPLCIIDLNSVTCERDDYSAQPRSVFNFKVKLWDFEVATIVQKALKQRNILAQTGDIILLPMQSVRIGLGNSNPNIYFDEEWRSFGDQPLTMSFALYPKDETFCGKMLNDAKTRTEFFLSATKLYFEYTLIASSTSSRHIKITGTSLEKASFLSNLTNDNADKDGNVYLTSEDANRLAHEVFNSVTFDEEVSADYKASKEEGAIVKELVKIFEQDKIQSIELTKENWDSVFWDDIFTRPDIQTSFLNETIKFNEKEKKFLFDKKKANSFRDKVSSEHSNAHKTSFSLGGMFEGFGLMFGFSHGQKHEDASNNEHERESINNVNVEDFNKQLEKNKWNVKWTGEKFEQKNFDLYRVNTKNIQTISENAFNRVIMSKELTGQQIEIKVETAETSKFDHIYDETTTTTTTTTTTPPSTTTIATTPTTTTTTPRIVTKAIQPIKKQDRVQPCYGTNNGYQTNNNNMYNRYANYNNNYGRYGTNYGGGKIGERPCTNTNTNTNANIGRGAAVMPQQTYYYVQQPQRQNLVYPVGWYPRYYG